MVSTSIGDGFTLFLDHEGFVWFTGKMCIFQTDVPTKMDNVEKICKISSGLSHCLLLDNDGNVFSCGNSDFQCQLGRDGNPSLPMKIENIPKIRTICCGIAHSILIDVEGNCYSFGNNFHGELGTGNIGQRITPIKIEGLPPIRSASAGNFHTILITEDGRAFGFGWNCYEQLGSNCILGDVVTPTEIKIEEAPKIKTSYCCGYSTILQDASLRSTSTIISGHGDAMNMEN